MSVKCLVCVKPKERPTDCDVFLRSHARANPQRVRSNLEWTISLRAPRVLKHALQEVVSVRDRVEGFKYRYRGLEECNGRRGSVYDAIGP